MFIAPCKWVKRPTASSKPCEIKDLVIGHQNLPTKRKNVKESISNSKVQNKKRKSGFHVYCENMEVDVRNEEDRNPPKYVLYVQYLNKIFQKLYNINSTVVAIRFLLQDLNTQL